MDCYNLNWGDALIVQNVKAKVDQQSVDWKVAVLRGRMKSIPLLLSKHALYHSSVVLFLKSRGEPRTGL